MKRILSFFVDLYRNRYLILQLTMRDVTQQYRRSRWGMFWSLAEPLSFMVVLYVVFGIGLRGGRGMDIPFILYLVSGLAVVNFFNQTMTKGSNAVMSHAYLLKKVNFRMSILPVVTILAGIVDHLLFMIAVIAIIFLNGIFPGWAWFQVLYYLFALSLFLLGITWFTASVGVFFPDIQKIASVIGRIIFYFSPVIWSYDLIPESLQFYVRLNPLFYIVMGYRDSLFYSIPFWFKPNLTLYFWGCTLVVLLMGIFTFRRLRPQFADFV